MAFTGDRDSTAFFEFGTNVDEIALHIDGAMRRINASLAGGSNLDSGQLLTDSKRLGQVFANLETDLRSKTTQIRELFAGLGTGAVRPEEIQGKVDAIVRGAVENSRKVLASGFADLPRTTAERTNASAIGRDVAQHYVQGLVGAAQEERAKIGKALEGLTRFQQGDYKPLITAAGRDPIAYGEEFNRRQQLENLTRAERIIAKDPGLEMTDFANPSLEKYVRDVRDAAEEVGRFRLAENEPGGNAIPAKFTPDQDAIDELKELNAERREGEQVARRLTKEEQAHAQALEHTANAEKVLTESAYGTKKFAGRAPGPEGEFYKPSQAGLAEERNPYVLQSAEQAKRKFDDEVFNGQRLAAQFKDVIDVGSYAVLDREVYQLNKHGAERVRNEYVVEKILEQQDNALAQQVLKAQRLIELDGRRQLRSEQGRAQGFLPGFMNRFHRGEQSVITGLGGQVASAAAFSLAYGSLFALQGGIRDTINEFKDYQDSLTDLEVATKDSSYVTGDFVNTLGELARVSGANVGAALDTAARGIRAFGAEAKGAAEIQAVGEATNAAATKLSLISNKALPDATGDLIASGSAFSLMPDQLGQVVDAVANAKRTVGGDAAQISQGLALIAGGAQEAGFNLDEAAAVIGLVQARTDQSGQAIATRLTRIFQILAGSTGKSLAGELGVDPDQSLKKQIEAYAAIYSNADTSESVRNRIVSGVGGTANMRELLPLLKENETLQKAYAEALSNAGQGTDEFDRKTDNLVGTLKKISGTIRLIQVDLATSGLFAPLGAAVKILEPALHAVDRLLKAFNAMPEPLRVVAGIMADIYLVSKAIGMVQAANAATGFGSSLMSAGSGALMGMPKGSAATIAAVAAKNAADLEAAGALLIAVRNAEARGIAGASEQLAIAEANYQRVINVNAERRAAAEAASTAAVTGGTRNKALSAVAGGAGGAAGASTLRTGFASLLRFATSGPVIGIAAGVAALYAYNKIAEGSDQSRGFRKDFSDAQDPLGRLDGSAKSFEQAARDTNTAVGNLGKSKSNFLSGREQDRVEARLKEQKEVLERIADEVSKEESKSAKSQAQQAFGTQPIETVSDLADGITALQEAGANGITVLRVFKEALENPVQPNAWRRFMPKSFSGLLSEQLNAAIKDSIPQRGVDFKSGQMTVPGGTGDEATRDIVARLDKNQTLQQLALTPQEVEQLYDDVIKRAKSQGIKEGDKLTDAQVNDFISYAVDRLDLSDVARGAEKIRTDIFEALKGSVFSNLGDQRKERKRLISGQGDLSKSQLDSILKAREDGTWAGLEAAILEPAKASVPATDDGRIMERVTRQNRNLVRSIRGRFRGKDEGLDLLLDKVEHDYVEARVENLESLRRNAQGQKGLSRAEVRNIGRGFLKTELRTARNDVGKLIQIMELANNGALDAVEATLKQAAKVAREARLEQQRLIDIGLANAEKSPIGPYPAKIPGLYDAKITDEEKYYRNFRRARRRADVADKGGVFDTGSDNKNYEEPDDKDKPGEIRTARAAARAARLGGQLAPARAALVAARIALKEAEPGTVAYFEALGQLFEAQAQMRDAVNAYRTTIGQLRGDITDPVENARDALNAARRQLRSDRGRGKDVRAEDRLAVRQAQTQLESEKFRQRLSDVQTAEQLGKISHSKYLAYLDSEHNRLNAIKHRTRQQQDQLNEIDLAMKAAKDAADGQFNLGDINTSGLVYQVRRQAAEARAARASAGLGSPRATTNQTVTIAINGADVAKVRQIIGNYLNIAPSQTQTLKRRKV